MGRRVFRAGESFRIPADMNSAWADLLQSGETLFLDPSGNALEGLISFEAPLEFKMKGFDSGPRILAPLRAGERMFGVLIVSGEDLSQDDVPAITAFSNHLSIAMEKARLLENTITQAKLGHVLAEIAAAASSESDMARLMEVTGLLMLQALEFACCTFSVYDESTRTVSTLLSITNPENAAAWNLPHPGSIVELQSNPAVRRVLSSGTLLWLRGSNEVRVSDDGPAPAPLQVIVPMAASGKIRGLGTFYLDQPERRLSPDQMIFLQTGMEQITMALDKARLAAEAEIQGQIDRSLAKLVERTLASRDMNEVVAAALDGISDLIPCNLTLLISFDIGMNSAQILGMRGAKSQILDGGQVIALGDWREAPEYAMQSETVLWGKEPIRSTESLGGKLLQHGIDSWATLPLVFQDVVIGNLFIGTRAPEGFGSEHISVAKRFANHLAVALANAANYESAQRKANELTALYDLAMDIAGELELRPLLKKSLRRATELLGSMMGAIFLVDPAIDEITLIADYHLPDPPSILNLKKGKGLAGKVWAEAQATALAQTRIFGDPHWLQLCYASGAALAVPLLWEGEVRGVLAVFEPSTSRKFNRDEALLLERMAAQISLGIENVEKHEQINRRVNQLRVVNDVARRINILLDQEQLFDDVVRRVAHSLNLELVVLFLVDGDLLIEKASYYLPDDRHGAGDPLQLRIGEQGISGEAALSGNPVLVPNVSKNRDYIRLLPFERKVRSAVAIPLKLKGTVIGVLLAESERLAAFDQTDVDALQALGAHISTSIENARLYAETVQVRNRMTESEKLRSLGLMTSGIAHDFNNLLSIILAHAELALEQITDEQVRAHLEQVIASARDGGETIHRLQDFARTRKEPSEFVGVDINQIVEQAIELSAPKWKDQAQSQGIDIVGRSRFTGAGNGAGSCRTAPRGHGQSYF
ncbi:MAG: GAF domain-containing protein [Chloroflexi bacterium]|nr:GAF domain-containing protein [Chloroflexota bacterium]